MALGRGARLLTLSSAAVSFELASLEFSSCVCLKAAVVQTLA